MLWTTIECIHESITGNTEIGLTFEETHEDVRSGARMGENRDPRMLAGTSPIIRTFLDSEERYVLKSA